MKTLLTQEEISQALLNWVATAHRVPNGTEVKGVTKLICKTPDVTGTDAEVTAEVEYEVLTQPDQVKP